MIQHVQAAYLYSIYIDGIFLKQKKTNKLTHTHLKAKNKIANLLKF